MRDKKFGRHLRWTCSSSCLFQLCALSSLFLSLVATPAASPPGSVSLLGDSQCRWLRSPQRLGNQQGKQSKQRSFAGAEIPVSYQAPPGKCGRRRAKWNMTSVQRHVGASQPQLAGASSLVGRLCGFYSLGLLMAALQCLNVQLGVSPSNPKSLLSDPGASWAVSISRVCCPPRIPPSRTCTAWRLAWACPE